ncbi:MAG TPA: hypothetical protein PKA63_03930 [Oligoflexia bacterium]|nr:hypothetical protein [Oligoflexia bacterium]HMP47801.1 hypothetical protein [Oligoflexia bacterium]
MFSSEVLSALSSGLSLSESPLIELKSSQFASLSAHKINLVMRGIDRDYPDSSFTPLYHSLDDEIMVRHIGDVITRDAINSLPDFFEWCSGDYPEIKNRLSLQGILGKWVNGSNRMRLEIGRLLASTLHPSNSANGTKKCYKDGADYFDQPKERVLPLLYGKWIHELGADNRPNCLGKFQLLVAFGSLLKVDMLAVSPLRYTTRVLNDYRSAACSVIIETASKYGLQISAKRLSSLADVISHSKDRYSYPDLQHFAVLYRISKDEWMLVDPNAGLASISENSIEISTMYDELERVRKIAPGASLFHVNSNLEEELKEHLKNVNECSLRIQKLARGASRCKDWEELFAFFIEEGLADDLLGWNDFIDITVRDKSNRFELIAKRLIQDARRSESDNPESCDNHNDNNVDLSTLSVSEIAETLIYRFLKRGEDEMRNYLLQNVILGKAMHPLSEVSLAQFRMATATISHVAYDISLEEGLRAEEILYSFGLNEGQLYNVALGALPNNPKCSEHAERAKKLLLMQAHSGNSVRRFLKKGGSNGSTNQ